MIHAILMGSASQRVHDFLSPLRASHTTVLPAGTKEKQTPFSEFQSNLDQETTECRSQAFKDREGVGSEE